MKILAAAVVFGLTGTISGWAQSAAAPPPGTISRPANGSYRSSAPAGTISSPSDATAGGVTFTNASGGTYSVDQLASQLQRLRSAVDELLPTLSAFTETYSNSVTGGGQRTLGGTISGVLSGILNRNTNSSPDATQGSTTHNLLSALQRLLGTNAPAGSAVNGKTYEGIVDLQSNLQRIPSILDSLNISTNQYASPDYDRNNGTLTPTGR